VVCPRTPSLEGLAFFCFFFVIKKWSSFSLDPRLLLMQNIVQSKYKPRFRNISLLLKSNQLHKKIITFSSRFAINILSQFDNSRLPFFHQHDFLTGRWLSLFPEIRPTTPPTYVKKTSFYLYNRWVIYLPTNFPPEKPLINLHEKWKKLSQQPCIEKVVYADNS